MAQVVPDHVRIFAARHGVDLAKVQAESARGMTLLDVADYARRSGNGDLWAAAISAQFVWNSGGDPNMSSKRPAVPAAKRLDELSEAEEFAIIDGIANGRYSLGSVRDVDEDVALNPGTGIWE